MLVKIVDGRVYVKSPLQSLALDEAQSLQRQLTEAIDTLRWEQVGREHTRLLKALDELKDKKGVSRVEVGTQAQLSKANVSRICNAQWDRVGSLDTIEGHISRLHAAVHHLQITVEHV